jgi:hypothetical protein
VSGSEDYAGLSNGGNWSQLQACVESATSHSNLRIQFYPTVGAPTVDIDDVSAVLTITFTAHGFKRERARITIRNGRLPRVARA